MFTLSVYSQVNYTLPNAAETFANNFINNSSARTWGVLRTLDENDVQGFANSFIESMFLWIRENKLTPNALNLTNTDKNFKVKVVFTKFENNRTIARAHSPINYFDNNKENWKNIVLVDFDKWVQLNRHQKMWLMSHELMHEIFATSHGEGGQLMFPTIPDLNDTTKGKRIEGLNDFYTKSDLKLLKALESSWQFIWDNHTTQGKNIFMVLRTLRQTKGLD
ncbi:hypothetical protein N9D55_06865 [Flavobacteriaceae bacterium]|nr:hypothetical protein [Flavobacteriaceae bacterium]